MLFRIFAVLLLASTAVPGQWLNYPTAGIPRTRDGKPNLSAPPPKARDRQPDFSGLWLPENDPSIHGTNGELLPKLFIDIGRGLKPGELTMQPWAQQIMAERDRNFQADDPLTTCKPIGGPRLNALPSPIKVIQNPGLIVMMHEAEHLFRQVYTDGRKLPEDPQPSALGYSTARFERDALIIETIGFHDRGWLDAIGHPFSDSLHLTERVRRPTFGRLEVEMTIDDPKAYQKPFTVTQAMVLMPDTDLLEYFCAENERDIRHFVAK